VGEEEETPVQEEADEDGGRDSSYRFL